MATIFSKISKQAGDIRRSGVWYRNAVSTLGNVTPGRAMRAGKINARPTVGRLNLFFYNPKTKEKLPYYDTFPLVLPIGPMPKGFLGINFHYLSPNIRFRLLQQLQRFASNTKFDSTTRLNINWGNVGRMSLIRPTVKRYLWGHVGSGFLRINLDDAPTAVYLPVQRFRKASAETVYARSRRGI